MDSEGRSFVDSTNSSVRNDSRLEEYLHVFPEFFPDSHKMAATSSPHLRSHQKDTDRGFYVDSSGRSYPIVQINGCRHTGPPAVWNGPEPTDECELFIRDIPKTYLEAQILPHFERFGVIHSFRLMMDYTNLNRGYGYIRYSTEKEATCAMDVLQHLIVSNKRYFSIQKSLHKKRLFVGNLPRNISYQEIYNVFKIIFPKMTNFILNMHGEQNRGFGFIDFPDHQSAIDAKLSCSPGFLPIWNQEIKVVWAHPEKVPDADDEEAKTLFIRNIGPEVNASDIRTFLERVVLDPRAILQLSPVRDFAFVNFSERSVAMEVKEKLNGQKIKHTPVDIQWARPPAADSLHQLKKRDFYNDLRLKCIANLWDYPVFVYGRIFESRQIQTVGVLIKRRNYTHVYMFEVNFGAIGDIQSRLSELILTMIDVFGHLPVHHLVMRIDADIVTPLGYMFFHPHPYFVPSALITPTVKFYYDEVYNIALFAKIIADTESRDLVKQYEAELKNREKAFAYLRNFESNGRILGCIDTFNTRKPLKYNFDNSQLHFALCDAMTQTNYMYVEDKLPQEYPLEFFYPNGVLKNQIYLQQIQLLPMKFIYNKNNLAVNRVQFIKFGQISLEVFGLVNLLHDNE